MSEGVFTMDNVDKDYKHTDIKPAVESITGTPNGVPKAKGEACTPEQSEKIKRCVEKVGDVENPYAVRTASVMGEELERKSTDCSEIDCRCSTRILEVKSNPSEPNTRIIRFVGVTDAPSNGQKFDGRFMKSIVDRANKKIESWKSSGKTPATRNGQLAILLLDKSNHSPDTHAQIVGFVEHIDHINLDTKTRKDVHYMEAEAKTFDPNFNRVVDNGLIQGWSIGFYHEAPIPEVYDDNGNKITQDAEIIHWVASLDPADTSAKTLAVSAKTKVKSKGEEMAEETKKTGEEEKTAGEEEELYIKKGEKFIKKVKGEEEEKKVKGEEEEKLAKKTLELDAKSVELMAKEVSLELRELEIKSHITPADAAILKPIVEKLPKEQRESLYKTFHGKSAIPKDMTEQQAPATVMSPKDEKVLEQKTNPDKRKLEVKTVLSLNPENVKSGLIDRLDKKTERKLR